MLYSYKQEMRHTKIYNHGPWKRRVCSLKQKNAENRQNATRETAQWSRFSLSNTEKSTYFAILTDVVDVLKQMNPSYCFATNQMRDETVCQVVTNPCCGLAVIFCGFISHLIGRETINISRNFVWCSRFYRKD